MSSTHCAGLLPLLIALGTIPLLLCCVGQLAGQQKAGQEKKDKAQSLFDGRSLQGWKTIELHDFKRHGEVKVKDGAITLGKGQPATGIRYTRELPRMNYEVTLEAKRVDGHDFFCGLTFPYAQEYCTLIVGGWGGGVTGLSNIDDIAAVENETTDYIEFKQDRWYKIRLRVTSTKVEAWVDDRQIVDLKTKDRAFSIWWEQEPVRPFGIATWNTAAALRKIHVRRLEPNRETADKR